MSENRGDVKEVKSSGLRPPSKIPSKGPSRLPSSSSIKLDGPRTTVSETKKKLDGSAATKRDGSDTFMGDARRLSEAGVRRSSGNSVVLTEDTDKFIIGNRIWVGGTKPGHIAYIGETNFGTGDWAGIVLDEPIGKNDGSVSGTRYFQCEPKKGVFARLTNLTSAPLQESVDDSMAQSSFVATKPLGFSTPMPKRQGSIVTSVKSGPKSISQQSVTKAANQSILSKTSSELKIGDRVIISSGQGSKLGYLRYRGLTQFAPGEWCGIELDDPLGKNNGTVEGIRYFECEDRFGLFTPTAKVSKSPMSANRLSTNCAIHKTKRSPESMNGSVISTITTTTMSSIPTRSTKVVSDLDRLKLQLTQVKNDNELLRSQVIKAANQADVAEKRLEEALKARSDGGPSEAQVNTISALQNRLDSIEKQMDEYREKVQNLQFTNEEQNVVNVELQNNNAQLLIKIRDLDSELDKERDLTKDVEAERMRIFEKEEELCRVKEELESLKKLIDNNEDELQKSVSNLSSEVVDKETVLNALRQTMNENSQTHERLLKEADERFLAATERLNRVIEEKNKKLEQNREMIDQLNEGIKCLSALKNDEHDEIVNGLKNELSKLKDEHKAAVDGKERDAEELSENRARIENELKSLLEDKNREIERLQKECADLTRSNGSEKDTVEKLTLELRTASDELNELKGKKLVYSKEALETALEQQVRSALVGIEGLQRRFDESISLKNTRIETCHATLARVKGQLIESKSRLETALNEKIDGKDDELKAMSAKLSSFESDVEKLESVNRAVTDELKTALRTVEDKTNAVASLERKYGDLERQQNLNRGELETEFAAKLASIGSVLESVRSEKSALEVEHKNFVEVTANATKDAEDELNRNNVLIEQLKRSIEELTLSKRSELDSVNEKTSRLEREQEQTSKRHAEELAARDERIGTLTDELERTLTEKQKQSLSHAELRAELTDETAKYETSSKDLRDRIEVLEAELASSRESFEKDLKSSNDEREAVRSENASLSEKLKSSESSRSDLEAKLASNEVSRRDVDELRQQVVEKNKIIDDNRTKIEQLDESIARTKSKFESTLNEKEAEIQELLKIGQEKMNMEKLSLEEKTKVILDEKEKENAVLVDKIKGLESVRESFEKQLDANRLQQRDLEKLNKDVAEKIKTIDDNGLEIARLNDRVLETKNELEAKISEKDDEIKELLSVGEEKLKEQKEQYGKTLDEKARENSNLLEKINVLEGAKASLEERLEASKTQANTIAELKSSVEEKTRIIDEISSEIERLNSAMESAQKEFDSKLKEKENVANELIRIEGEKSSAAKSLSEQNTERLLAQKDKEISDLVEKLSVLDGAKTDLEKRLEIGETRERDIIELRNSVDEKNKVIAENDAKIERLNATVVASKEEFDAKLKAKEDAVEALAKNHEEELTSLRLVSERTTATLLDDKNKEIRDLVEKLSASEDAKADMEKRSGTNEAQERAIAELKRSVDERDAAIADNNAKIELLSNVAGRTKEEFDARLREKENEADELVEAERRKSAAEKSELETRLDAKNEEIESLKTRLLESVARDEAEKELSSKLESVAGALETEKNRASGLEAAKNESDEKLLDKMAEIERLEESKANAIADMTKTIAEQRARNAELAAEIETASERSEGENAHVRKEIDELKTKCSGLLTTIDERNREIESLKTRLSADGQSKTVGTSSDEELNRLKALLDKDRSAQSHLEFRIQELTDENHRLNERIEGDHSIVQKNNNIIQEKYNIEKKYEETYSMLKIKENQILVLQTELNSWKLKDMGATKNNNQQKTDKTEAHLLAEKNEEIKLLNSIILGLHKKLSAVMETDVSELEIEKNPGGVSKEEYQKLYKTAKNNIKLKECETLSLKQEIYKLKTENERYSEFKSKCESLENDKKNLQKLIVNYESSNPANGKNGGDVKSETDKILEEKDWQINLLNKIVADLHSKVSDNKFKIDGLEKQILDSGMDQNKKVRLRTTRLYCERCEIFDSHDTDDCPEKPESPKCRKRRVVNDNTNRSVAEPFCVCCGSFGHESNECGDSSLTF